MKDIDKSYWEYGAARKAKKEVAKNFLLDGDSVEKVSRNTGLPQSTVLELKKEIDSPDTWPAKQNTLSPFIERAFACFEWQNRDKKGVIYSTLEYKISAEVPFFAKKIYNCKHPKHP